MSSIHISFFKSQDEMLEQQKLKPNSFIFTQDISKTGAKKFALCDSFEDYINYNDSLKDENKNCHEFVLNDVIINEFYDVELKGDFEDYKQKSNEVIKDFLSSLKEFHAINNFEIRNADFKILQACHSKKISFHIIVPKYQFKNIYCHKKFISDYKEFCEKNNYVFYPDEGVYKKNTTLRMIYNTKMGKNYPLLPISSDVNEKDYLIKYQGNSPIILPWSEYVKPKKEIQLLNQLNNSNKIEILKEIVSKITDDDYTTWTQVCWGLYNLTYPTLLNEGKKLFFEYSRNSVDYHEEACDRLWENSTYKEDGISLGTLKKLAGVRSSTEQKTQPKLIDNLNFYNTNVKTIKNIIPFINSFKNEKGIQIIRGEYGMGKTHQICEFEKLNDKYNSLIVSATRALTKQLCKRTNFDLYSDGFEKNKLITTIESIYKIRVKPDILYIDEFCSVRRALSGLTCRKNGNLIFSTLIILLKNTEKIIILDADISPDDIYLISKLSGRQDITFYDYVKSNREKKTYTLINSEALFVEKLLSKVEDDKKIAICSSSPQFLKTLLKYNELQNKKVLLITAETEQTTKDDIMQNIEKLEDYDVFLYSPSVKVGVSFDNLHFDYIFAHHCSKSNITCDEFAQMIRRVRITKNREKEIICFIPYSNNECSENLKEEVEKYVQINEYYGIVERVSIGKENDFQIIKDDPYYDVYLINKKESYFSKNHFYDCFIHKITSFGDIIKKDFEKAEKLNKDDIKEKYSVVKEEDVLKVYNADLISYEDAEKIVKKIENNKSVLSKELLSLKKYKILNHYNINIIKKSENVLTQDIFKKLLDKKNKERYRLYKKAIEEFIKNYDVKQKFISSDEILKFEEIELEKIENTSFDLLHKSKDYQKIFFALYVRENFKNNNYDFFNDFFDKYEHLLYKFGNDKNRGNQYKNRENKDKLKILNKCLDFIGLQYKNVCTKKNPVIGIAKQEILIFGDKNYRF